MVKNYIHKINEHNFNLFLMKTYQTFKDRNL